MPEQGSTVESVFDEVSQSAFSPYDPEAVQPTSSSPAPSTQSGEIGDTSGEDGEAAQRAQDPGSTTPPPEFDPRYQDAFTGLMYLGALKDTFTAWGHEFVIRTLTTEDIAEVGLLLKRYEGTIAFSAVYQAATLAAALVTIDGRPLPQPLGPADSNLEGKMHWVTQNLFPPVRARLWQKYFALEQEVDGAVEAMGNPSG